MSSSTTHSEDSSPLVTVVIPLYNGADYIAETLTSVQRQRAPRVEVIIVDDGSTDNGREVAGGHSVQPTVLIQQHLGVAVARNRGLAAAKGRWVAFLDQDDLWHPTHLERLIQWLSSHPGERIAFAKEIAFTTADDANRLREMDDLAGGWASVHAARDQTLDDLVQRTDVSGTGHVVRHDLTGLLNGPVSVTTSFVAEPELLRLAGGFAPHALAMDDYWLLANVARLQPIVQLDQPTVFYRVHTRATSRTTKLGLPFLSSAVALRFGGGLVSSSVGLRGGGGELHLHLLGELLASPEYRDASFRHAVDHLAGVLWPPTGRRRQRCRARLAARMPWLRTIIRRLPPALRLS